jgi:hypothetical protein
MSRRGDAHCYLCGDEILSSTEKLRASGFGDAVDKSAAEPALNQRELWKFFIYNGEPLLEAGLETLRATSIIQTKNHSGLG